MMATLLCILVLCTSMVRAVIDMEISGEVSFEILKRVEYEQSPEQPEDKETDMNLISEDEAREVNDLSDSVYQKRAHETNNLRKHGRIINNSTVNATFPSVSTLRNIVAQTKEDNNVNLLAYKKNIEKIPTVKNVTDFKTTKQKNQSTTKNTVQKFYRNRIAETTTTKQPAHFNSVWLDVKELTTQRTTLSNGINNDIANTTTPETSTVAEFIILPLQEETKLAVENGTETVTQSATTAPSTLPMTRASIIRTMAPALECIYQYPEEVHTTALLSNMMNQLTKIFSRVFWFMNSQRRAGRQSRTRYVIVNKTNTDFFNKIYRNMSEEFKKLYRKDQPRASANYTTPDPCQHQDEIRDLWIDLVERSSSALRSAALKCVEGFLDKKSGSIASSPHGSHELRQFLTRELTRLRSSHLHLLCDNFQLCYSDLLR